MIKYFKLFLFTLVILIPHQAHATAYYVDETPGRACNGAGTATTTAFCVLDQFTDVARNAGDIVFVRRGIATTTAANSDITFTSDGTLNNPIIISSDYDNLWNEFATSSVTWTPTFGSKFIASSASSTDFTVNSKWIYFEGDCQEIYNRSTMNPCEYAYEVASSSPSGIDLYLPYKGPLSGSGKNMRVMPFAPPWNTTTGSFQWGMSGDNYWFFKGIDIRSTHGSCNLSVNNSYHDSGIDLIFQGDGITDCSFILTTTTGNSIKKWRSFGQINAVTGIHGYLSDAYIDCNNVASSNAFAFNNLGLGPSQIKNIEVKNCTNTFALTTPVGTDSQIFSNLIAPHIINSITGDPFSMFFFEDRFGIVGFNTSFGSNISSNTSATTTTATTTNLRPGGGPWNLFITPPSGTGNTGISTRSFPFSYIKLFEYPIYTNTSSKTYTMYFNSTSTTQWVQNPLATSGTAASSTDELFIECEYYADASDADRFLKRSATTSAFTVNFTGSTAWQAISVTCQPTQAGILYLRGWYAKPVESGLLNEFYMDTTPVIQ